MAKITLVFCDVKPCKLPAEREFEFNGQKIYVCGESCFVKFWSREYVTWKQNPYLMEATFHSGRRLSAAAAAEQEATAADLEGDMGAAIARSGLQVVKF